MLQAINSYQELKQELMDKKSIFLLLYKAGSEQSEKALHNLKQAYAQDPEDLKVLYANVTEVRDIHPVYDIKTAPSLLEFEGDQLRSVHKGAHEFAYYLGVLEKRFVNLHSSEEGKKMKSVTVYSTPTCSWCNTLKSWLRKNRISFTDVDVSKDQNAAEDLVSRTGQKGVPQTEIDGQWVVGFDQTKLKRLLEINVN